MDSGRACHSERACIEKCVPNDSAVLSVCAYVRVQTCVCVRIECLCEWTVDERVCPERACIEKRVKRAVSIETACMFASMCVHICACIQTCMRVRAECC